MSILKQSANVFLKSALGIFISFFLVLSLIFIVTVVTSESEGYTVYENTDSGRVALYEHNYADGEDNLYQEYEAEGRKLDKIEKKSEISDKDRTTTYIFSQICTLIICILIIYTEIWKIGNRDYNAVLFGREEKNITKGLKIGLISNIPSAIVYILLLLSRYGVFKPNYLPLFRLLNSHFYGFTYFVYGNTVNANELSTLQTVLLFLPVLLLPIVSTVAYIVGYKDISLMEKFVYKKRREEKK